MAEYGITNTTKTIPLPEKIKKLWVHIAVENSKYFIRPSKTYLFSNYVHTFLFLCTYVFIYIIKMFLTNS
jgi:hypothetical protein